MKQRYLSISIKLLIGYLFVFISLISLITLFLQSHLRSKLEEATLKQIETNGELIVGELVRRTTLVNTLSQSIVSASTAAQTNSSDLKKIIAQLINLPNTETFIAGGGYWPEPYSLDKDKERASLFWGRDKQAKLRFYNDYNFPEGPGYHQEEWYVPAQFLQDGKCYWSRSYTDPYSGQPMVTCTVAARKDNVFVGAATIDLKLEGLAEFFANHTKNTGGYAFAVDQHNRFISYPNNQLVFSAVEKIYITAPQLAEKEPLFSVIANLLEEINNTIKTEHSGNITIKNTVKKSYQVSDVEAEMIATTLTNPLEKEGSKVKLLQRIEVTEELLLKEPSTISIFHVPNAYWKVIVVTPTSRALSDVNKLLEESLKNLLIPLIVLMAIVFFGIRKILLNPINKMTETLKKSAEINGHHFNLLDENSNDEFGQFAYWYNVKNKELNEAIKKLSKANQELLYHANYDVLTDLPNRRDFEQKLQSIKDSDLWENYSLLYIDMDQFKLINDTCGHSAGDQLLIQLGNKLRHQIRDKDFVARIGGDEFAIIANTPTPEILTMLANRLVHAISDMTFSWDKANFSISCSIGAIFLGNIPKDTTLAMKYVDTACYAAKEAGRNRFHLYQHDDIASQRAGEMNWIAKINDALENNSFHCEFQLIAPSSFATKEDYCIEALIRLKHEDGSNISPAAFLPAAERYNTIAKIDRWMIENTFRTLANHRETLDRLRFCSINLSGDSICSEELINIIKKYLATYKIPAEKICFEITETQAMLNINQAKKALSQIKALGCFIALDDFGSGMSSYGYLKQLPVNFLKIDGSFVRNIKEDKVHRTFVKSMGEIATAMGLETIAEYVEDMQTYHLLQTLGIDYAQGFGIAKPIKIEKIAYLLKEKNLIKST